MGETTRWRFVLVFLIELVLVILIEWFAGQGID